ncbi:MAG: hypothetical protein JWN78_3053 [Bacteroidota bacterium]|nr:hypothetical protein [Bacteroidota bacterium]
MYVEKNFIDYGIYIDHQEAFIISLDHLLNEKFIAEEVHKNHNAGTENISGSTDFSREKQLQHRHEDHLKKFCKGIIAKLDKAHRILIFGPATAKYELQKEVLETKSIMIHLKREELLTTQQMNKEEALRFVKHHFAPSPVQENQK